MCSIEVKKHSMPLLTNTPFLILWIDIYSKGYLSIGKGPKGVINRYTGTPSLTNTPSDYYVPFLNICS